MSNNERLFDGGIEEVGGLPYVATAAPVVTTTDTTSRRRLGCGTYDVWFKVRGGSRFFARAEGVSSINWARKLNDVSEASVTMNLNGMTPACCGAMANINPWEHEMSIFRSGEEVWCGPVTGGEYDNDKGTLQLDAKDLMAWFDHRWVEVSVMDQYFDEVDVAEIMLWLVNHGYSKDPFNLDFYVQAVNVPMTKEYVAYVSGERWGGTYPLIGDEIRSLTESGIDYTVVRRTMLSGNLHRTNQSTFTLTERHWATLPKIPIVGSTMATDLAIMGGNGGYGGWYDDQMYIARSTDAIRTKYGLLQAIKTNKMASDVDTTTSPNPISQQAQQQLAIREAPFVYLEGGSLSPDAPVTMDMLIPGSAFAVKFNATCRAIEDTYRLYGVNAQITGDIEDVSLEMTPIGAETLAV